jgi:hypothetical protein
MANADNAGRSKSATRWSAAFIAGAGCAVGRGSGVHPRPIASPTIPHPHHRFALTLSARGVSSYRRDSTEAPRSARTYRSHSCRLRIHLEASRRHATRDMTRDASRWRRHSYQESSPHCGPSICVGDEARGSAVIFVFCAHTQRKRYLAGWLSHRAHSSNPPIPPISYCPGLGRAQYESKRSGWARNLPPTSPVRAVVASSRQGDP